MLSNNNLATFAAEKGCDNVRKCPYLVNLSTRTRITFFAQELGNPLMKSIEIRLQAYRGFGSGCSNSGYATCFPLHLWALACVTFQNLLYNFSSHPKPKQNCYLALWILACTLECPPSCDELMAPISFFITRPLKPMWTLDLYLSSPFKKWYSGSALSLSNKAVILLQLLHLLGNWLSPLKSILGLL